MHQRKLTSVAVAIAACTIIASQVAMYWHGKSEQRTPQWIARSYRVIHDLESIDAGVVAARNALRAYAPSQDARAASTFSDALGRIRDAFLEAQELTWNDPVQRQKLHELAPMVADAVERMSDAYEQHEGEAAVARALEDAIGALVRSEQRLLVQRVQQSEDAHARLRSIAVVSASLALLIMLLVFLVLRRQGVLLTRSALIDPLTGLYNRRGFTLMAEHRMRLADRHGQPLHLLFIDLDDMKRINDQLGHDAGDAALVQTARLLESVFRESDVVARLGGDEFVVLAEADSGADLNLHDRIHHAVATRRLALSLSVGFALYQPRALTSLTQLLGEADAAMYRHKRKRKSSAPVLALSEEVQS